jgi:hypothetical protein
MAYQQRDEKDEYDQPPPPAPVDVAWRALVLSGVVCRACLEGYTDEEYKQQTAGFIREWFDELGLWPYLEPDEGEIIRAPFGALPHQLGVDGTWFVEGLAILAWALRRADFPPHDQKVDPIAVTNALDFLDPGAARLLRSPTLRPPAELAAAREWFYDIHCTLRQFLFYQGDGHLADGIGQYVNRLGLDPDAVLFEGGLAIDGGPLARAGRERLEVWEWAIRERHRAAIWLRGEYALYTELPVDT